MDAVALLVDDNMNAHRLFQIDSVIVDEALSLKTPVLPLGERLAQPRFRNLEQAVEAGENFCLTVFGRELVEPLFAQPVGAELTTNVAKHELRSATVSADDALNIADRFS